MGWVPGHGRLRRSLSSPAPDRPVASAARNAGVTKWLSGVPNGPRSVKNALGSRCTAAAPAHGNGRRRRIVSGRRGRRFRLVAALALAGFIAVVSCRERGDEAVRPSPAPTTRANVDGVEVTLTGQIMRTFGMHVIQLGTAPRDPLIVVLRRPEPVFVGQRVEVSGEVRTFRRAELQSELAVDLGAEVHNLEGQRCLLARSVRLG